MAGEELNAKKMKVSELREALKERGLSTDGLKGDLVNRLEAYLEEQEFALPGEGSGDLPPTPTGAAKPAVEEPAVPAPVLEETVVEETKEVIASKEKPAAAAELEKETATAGTEPSPAPIVPPEPTPAATTEKPTSEMTFDEKRAARAARFGIPVVETKKTSPKKRPQNDNEGSNKKQKRGGNKPQQPQKQKKSTPQKKETPLLSVEEIEKRLKRAEKFGTGDNAQTQELKAMLRKHRFAAASSTT